MLFLLIVFLLLHALEWFTLYILCKKGITFEIAITGSAFWVFFTSLNGRVWGKPEAFPSVCVLCLTGFRSFNNSCCEKGHDF